jgi:threonine 3-dehydrogenase
MKHENILITGANGQLGSVLVTELQKKHGMNHVIASDIRIKEDYVGIFETLDVTNIKRLKYLIEAYQVTQIYHLAAILSANGESSPLRTWDINTKTFFNVLEASVSSNVSKVFFPSSIAVFGTNAPKNKTPQNYVLNPSTVYGISKASGENWVQYYYEKHNLDIRSLRYPGIIGHQSLPGGGTTDYAIDVFHKAVQQVDFDCFLSKNRTLPMIYMDDAIRATIELMDAPKENIKIRTSYNLSGMSFSPVELQNSIHKIYPEFKINYKPDFRDKIESSWPSSIDDSCARKDWNWKPLFDINQTTKLMIQHLKEITLQQIS